MKALLIAIILQILFIHAQSQTNDLLTLFNKVDAATKQITSGQYKLNDIYTKVSVGEDSSKRINSYDYYFKSNPADTLIGYKTSSLCNTGLQQVYNGHELYVLTSWNKALEITPAANNQQIIKRLKNGIGNYPLLKLIQNDFQRTIKYKTLKTWDLAQNKVDYKGQLCYQISSPPNASGNNRNFSIYYVSAATFLPIGRTVVIENMIANAKEIQTFESWISDFKPNKNLDDRQFSKESLSGYDRETIVDGIVKSETKKLLKKGSIAPDWELPLINRGTLKLSDLKHKIVILDFWYKACAPCQKQMIDLQKLHDKFDQQKVVFVGINTLDDPIRDKLSLFLKNRALTMTSVYNGKQIEKLYHVYSSPALFIINGNGEIAFSLDGYSDTLIKDVTTEIEKIL